MAFGHSIGAGAAGNAAAGAAGGGMTPWQMFGAGSAAGSMLGGGLASMFMDRPDPAEQANQYLGQIPGTLKPYYDPYINAGRGALPGLQQQYNQLINNPEQLYNRFGAGYTQSPGYNFNLQQGQQAINNAQAAGGMLGSPQHQQVAGQLASQLASQDYENYLNHVLGLYGGGLTGMSGINQMGYNASNELANSLANILGTQGQLAYQDQAAQNAADAQGIGNLFGGLGAIASLAFI